MRQTMKLTALLAVALSALLAYAFVSEDVAVALHLKQVDVTALTADAEEAVAQAQVAEANTKPQKPEAVDTTAQRILLFGDSMSQPLALRLSDYAHANGHTLTCVTWVSSSTVGWASCDTLRRYMQAVKPTHVFVCLGSNELYTRDMKGCERHIRKILEMVGSVPVIWIGPPNWDKDYGINELLCRVMGKRAYFPSYELTFERQEDGRHPTYAASSMWMDKIVEWMNAGKSIHPIRMEKPKEQYRHYRQVVIGMPKSKGKSSAEKESGSKPAEAHEKAHTAEPAAAPEHHAAPVEAEKPEVPQSHEPAETAE